MLCPIHWAKQGKCKSLHWDLNSPPFFWGNINYDAVKLVYSDPGLYRVAFTAKRFYLPGCCHVPTVCVLPRERVSLWVIWPMARAVVVGSNGPTHQASMPHCWSEIPCSTAWGWLVFFYCFIRSHCMSPGGGYVLARGCWHTQLPVLPLDGVWGWPAAAVAAAGRSKCEH